MSDNAVVPVNEARVDLPEVWDRKSPDPVMQFARDLDARWRIANMLARSGMTRENKPEAIMAIALKSFEMGVPLMQALSGMYFADGKVGLEGHLMDALAIQRCGVRKKVHESTRQQCRMTLMRDGWEPCDVEYAIADAKRAGLIKDFAPDGTVTPAVSRAGKPKMVWVQHTEEMLYWRALSKGLKRIAPDYFGGVYHIDELQEAAGIADQAARVSTNAELDALRRGVTPDPDVFSDAEVEQIANELDAAEKAGAIDAARRNEVSQLVVDGKWTDAREAWEQVRADVLESLPAQTSLV